jgi:hypothetical protein
MSPVSFLSSACTVTLPTGTVALAQGVVTAKLFWAGASSATDEMIRKS